MEVQHAVSMSVGSPSATEVQLIYKLGSSYTVGLVAPKIKVTFDVSTALGAGNSRYKCMLYVA